MQAQNHLTNENESTAAIFFSPPFPLLFTTRYILKPLQPTNQPTTHYSIFPQRRRRQIPPPPPPPRALPRALKHNGDEEEEEEEGESSGGASFPFGGRR